MKKITFIALLCIIAVLFAAQPATKNDEQIITEFKDWVIKIVMPSYTANEPTCATQVEFVRKYWVFIPWDYQERIIEEVVNQLYAQLPGIGRDGWEKLIRDLLNKKVPAEEACENARRVIEEEIRRRNECLGRCIDAVDVSPERILQLVIKCKTTIRCYLEEIQQEMENLANCIRKCIIPNGNGTQFVDTLSLLAQAFKK